jgi:hypothetical protein
MSAAVYATEEDLYKHRLPRGSLVSRSRLIASADATLNRLELEGHALPADMPVTLVVDAGGALPAPLAALTVYYAKLVALDADTNSESLFQLAASPGGAAIDLTDGGTAPFRLHVSHKTTVQRALEVRSRWVDGFAYGHAVPFVAPYPVGAVEFTARAASIDLRRDLGLISDDQADGMLASLAKDAERVMRGVRLRDAAATKSVNSAAGASPTSDATLETIP